ncbi:ABC transporter permease, partial [Clostridioides sp. ES-S-0190-01]|nr:ABC transporter permease [Clostridioides sp. ES-S-0190-01]
LIALSGSLMAQFLGFSDVNMGIGTLVLGIASIIIGITLFKKFTFIKNTTAIIVGSFIYQFTIYFAMSLGMLSTDLKLITAIVIIAFLATSNLNISLKKNKYKASTKNKSEKRGVIDVTN